MTGILIERTLDGEQTVSRLKVKGFTGESVFYIRP